MRSLLSLFVCLTLLTTVTFAQDEKPAAPKAEKESPFKTLKERASYGIGQNMAARIKFDDQLDLDFDIVIQGFSDSLKDKEPKMTERQIQDAMIELQKAMVENLKKPGQEFLAKNGQREGVVTTKSGLQYEVIKKGQGKVSPKPTDTVTTHYHGTLIDGTVFDSSVQRGEPIDFRVDRVIKGWTEALQLMKVGDKYKLYIPSDLAYGERGAGGTIRPHSALIFEVELIAINGEKN